MRIVINPVVVHTESGDVPCSEAEASVAVSNSTAIRLVPVGSDGTKYPDAAMGIVGDSSVADIAEFMATVQAAVTTLALSRGL